MKKLNFIVILSLVASTLGACQALPRINDTRPNFLIIVTDDQRYDTMEYMPNTQELIFDQGVTFSRSQSGSALARCVAMSYQIVVAPPSA